MVRAVVVDLGDHVGGRDGEDVLGAYPLDHHRDPSFGGADGVAVAAVAEGSDDSDVDRGHDRDAAAVALSKVPDGHHYHRRRRENQRNRRNHPVKQRRVAVGRW